MVGSTFRCAGGDGALLDAYLVRGDVEAFAGLARRHRDADYAAWKLGYEFTVLDLLIAARAGGLRFRGCDMPAALQERSRASQGPSLRHRLREIHCVHSLPPSGGKPRRAALLWGDAHLGADGLRRFLPPAAAVLSVHLVGKRLEPGALEIALAKELSSESRSSSPSVPTRPPCSCPTRRSVPVWTAR